MNDNLLAPLRDAAWLSSHFPACFRANFIRHISSGIARLAAWARGWNGKIVL
jgi:hypothetical protein